MTFLRYSFLSTALALGLFVAVPALASASTLYVDVNVNNSYNDDDRDPNDFTVEVWGNDVSPQSFKGTSSGKGKKVSLDEGYYSVSIRNTYGYTPSFSSNCSGFIDDNETEDCKITLRDSGNYYPSYYDQGYQYPYYNNIQPTVYNYTQPTISKGYIPYLPNTGFEPQNGAALAVALVLLLATGFFLYPHVRKAFTVILR